MIKRTLLALLALLLLLVAGVAANTGRQGSRQIAVAAVAPPAIDKQAAAESLAEAVRARTTSGLLDPVGQAQAFEALQVHLRTRYPLVHGQLEREVVAGHSLLYTWRGSDAAARPMALMAHQDVVPIAPGTDAQWKQPPFAGAIADGFIWGRGAWDNKGNLVSQLEAVEMLLATRFQPRRTVYLIYGHDEEIGGQQGAVAMAALLKQRGVQLEYVIDEGLLVTERILPGIEAPIALVGVAEKGFVSLRLVAQAAPGHSSMPPATGQGAIGMLSAALASLDAQPMPGGIQGVAEQMFDVLAPEFSGFQRVALSNLWLFRPVVERMLAKGTSTNAMMRTTTAMTVFNAGIRENVLPGRAEAIVNFRLLPGDTPETVSAHVRRAIDDDRIQIEALPIQAAASRISASDSAAYGQIARAVREVFPGALVGPGLMLAGTDGRHFEGVADDVYRFSPVRARAEDLARFHGTDERISVDNFAEMIHFYHRLLQLSAGS